MKKIISAITICLIMGLILISSANAALPGPGWWTFYQFQNIDSATANIIMTAYDKNTSSTYNGGPFSLAPGAALAYNPGLTPNYPSGDRVGFSPDLPSGFEGSVVLSSDKQMIAVAQIGNNSVGSVGSGGRASAFYQAIGSVLTDNELFFPTVKNNFQSQTTTYYIQAAGADANVTIEYTMNDGQTYTQNTTISANKMFAFDPSSAGVPAGSTAPAASNPSLGAARVTSTTGKIAGVVVEYPTVGSPAPYVLSTRGLISADIDTTLIAPTIKNNFNGGTTGLSVQNTGSADALVQIDLIVTNASNPSLIGNSYTDQEIIPAGGSVVFSAFRDNLGGMPSGTFASATITSIDDATYDPQPLAGMVNETNSFGKATYAAFAKKSATTTVGFPIVKEMFSGSTTGVAVVNVGTAPTKFYATYIDQNGVSRTFETTSTVLPGAAVSFFKVYTNPSSKFTGLSNFSVLFGTKNSVVITSDGVQPIVGLAQESDQDPSNGLLDVKNYEGFPLP